MENPSPWFRSDESKDEKAAAKGRQNVSFKFSKLAPKAFSGNKLSDGDANLRRETVFSLENKEIKSSVPKEDKKKLVIPPIQKNVWRNEASSFKETENVQQTSEKSINDLAIEELLKESASKKTEWESREPQNIRIPMVIQNKLPEGFETDDKLDVTLRADDSTLRDYEDVPIEDFGAAVLRGLGCNPGDPIGNKNKQLVTPIEAKLRSKGLGLGADKTMEKKSQAREDKEELKLATGSYICVTHGTHKGSYGMVEGLDESRVIIKLNQLDKNISLPVLYVTVISKKEFQKESKVINKDAYDKYNDEYLEKNGRDSNNESRSRDAETNGNSAEPQDDLEDDGSHHSKHRQSSKLKRKHSHKESHKKHSSHHTRDRHQDSWVCPLLRVRFIDKEYKKGKYFNQKVVIEDVVSAENCVCKTEDGKYLDDVQPSMLETLIPRSESGHVMIVKGKHKSQLGAVLSRDKRECAATVQLLSDRSKVVVLDYDSICEYIGDTSLFD